MGAASEDALPHSKKTKQTKRKTDGHIRRTDTGGSGAAQRTPDEPQEPQSRGGPAAGTAAANGGGRVAEQMGSDCPLEEELQQEHEEEHEEQGWEEELEQEQDQNKDPWVRQTPITMAAMEEETV